MDTLLGSLSAPDRLSIIVSSAGYLIGAIAFVLGGLGAASAAFANWRTKRYEIRRQEDEQAFKLLSIASGGPETYIITEREIRGPLFDQQIMSIALLRQHPRQLAGMQSLLKIYQANATTHAKDDWNPWLHLRDAMQETVDAIAGTEA